MNDADPAHPDPGNIANTGEPDAKPFVIAFVGFVIVAILAFVYLREDADLEIVRPDGFDTVDDDTIRVFVDALDPCQEVERVQVDVLDEDRLFVEAVVRVIDGDCTTADARQVVLTVNLPQPIDDRALVAGVGRVQLPCDSSGTCGPDQ